MKKITLLFFLMLISVSSVFSQEITEGREYWFGLPHCMKSSDEYVRWGVYPVELWISSKYDAIASIEALDGNLQPQTVAIRKDEITIVSLPDNLENRESEVVKNYGIHIFADAPISVVVFHEYMWTGETYRLIPVEALGKEYFTLNMYQDYVKMHTGNMEYKPGQITICATEDSTEVSYFPSCETEKGVKKGESSSITLNKGQTFAIKNKIFPALNQSWETDLTGTQITSNKPIAVISGHTKVCFPKYTGTMWGIKADFMRNMLVEMLPPTNLLGYEYISVPFKYLDRTVYDLIKDDRGDIIRFVATEDSTIIYQKSGTTYQQISDNLNKGDWFDILNQEQPVCYRSNKKVLVGQYGKAWLSNLPLEKIQTEDEPQNPSRNGQGMLLTLTPINRWYNSAVFYSVPNMDNFLYLTFFTDEASEITFDNNNIVTKYGNAIKQIAGTPFSYLVQNISSGNHTIKTTESNVNFAAYAYGNWDASKDGFAYGYPAGMSLADDCNDSLFVVDNAICGMVEVVVKAVDLSVDTTCAGIYSVIFRDSKSNNCRWMSDMDFQIGDTTYNFSIDIVNPFNSSVAVIDIISKSGKFLQKEYKYFPEIIGFENTYLDFGVLAPEETKCLNLVIKNNGAVDLTVYEFKLKGNRTEFKINTELPFTLEPNEEKVIEICASYTELDESKIRDSLIAVLECYEKTIAGLQFITNEPVVFIEDADWGIVPVGVEIPKNVMIRNESYVEVEINSISWSDLTHFTRVEGLNLPLTISPNSTYQFTVYYKPDVPFVQHTDTAFFTSNATKTKLYSVWNGIGTVTPKLLKPSKDTTNIAIEVDFEWEVLANTGYYRLMVSNESNFQFPILVITSPEHNYSYTFEKNTKYYWRVCAGDGENFGAWSEVWTFTTGNFSDVKNNIKTNNSFSIFPNPADNELYIEFSNEFSNNCEIEIIDMQGITVSSIKKSNLIYGTNKEQISLKELPFGTYFCILEIGGNRYSKMFVKM